MNRRIASRAISLGKPFLSAKIARQHEVSQAIFADENEFPREIALEAILRFIEEDLESGAAVTASP